MGRQCPRSEHPSIGIAESQKRCSGEAPTAGGGTRARDPSAGTIRDICRSSHWTLQARASRNGLVTATRSHTFRTGHSGPQYVLGPLQRSGHASHPPGHAGPQVGHPAPQHSGQATPRPDIPMPRSQRAGHLLPKRHSPRSEAVTHRGSANNRSAEHHSVQVYPSLTDPVSPVPIRPHMRINGPVPLARARLTGGLPWGPPPGVHP